MPLRPPPRYINFLKLILFMARDPSRGSDRGITQEIQPREWEKKNKRTIWALVSSKCKKGSSMTLHSLCICRLTLACILREISTKRLGMPTHLDWSLLLSVFDCLSAVSSPTDLSGFIYQLPLCASPCQLTWLLLDQPFLPHFRSRPRSWVPALCLVSCQNRQRDRLLSGPPT